MTKSIELIKSDRYRNFLACIDTEIEKKSDFEKFSLVCDNISLMLGSMFYRELIYLLREELGVDICYKALCDREIQKKLWRKLNGDDSVSLKNLDIIEKVSEQFVLKMDESSPLILNMLLKEVELLPNDLDTFIDCIKGDIALDISNFEYLRPNEYHAKLTYGKLLHFNECERNEMAALELWVLCRSVMKNDVSVYLFSQTDISAAWEIVRLFESRRLYPNVYICFKPTDIALVEFVSKLCLMASKKNVSSEIIISDEIEYSILERGIRKLVSNLPLSHISLCGFLSGGNSVEFKDLLG